MKKLLALAAFAALLGGCATHEEKKQTAAATPPPAEEPAAVTMETGGQAPTSGTSKHVFENDKVRVTRYSLAEGQRVPMPETPNEMLYPLQNCKLRLDSVDGRSWDINQKKDQVIWSESAQRGAETVGQSSCDFVLIEVK